MEADVGGWTSDLKRFSIYSGYLGKMFFVFEGLEHT
jgi:hypothetical protein